MNDEYANELLKNATPYTEVLEGEVIGGKDIEKLQHDITLRVQNSPEVKNLANQIDVGNPQTVLQFGQESAEEISKFADTILRETSKSDVQESGRMLKDLANIMKSFDLKDFEDKKPSLLSKIFKSVNNEIEKILGKYQTLDKDIERVFVKIREYEAEIKKSDKTLENMFKENMAYYENLTKYIAAGEYIKETTINEWLPELQAASQSGDAMALQRYNDANDFVELIDQRIHDLELARMVSMQTAPQIKMIQKGNHNLMRKINSAFVVTLPIFKMNLSQAITMKRQRIQADALKAVDDATNEMLLKNANNIRSNSVDIARLAGNSSVDMETLENTFQTIIAGIDETLQIEEENKQKRSESRSKLTDLQKQLKEKKF